MFANTAKWSSKIHLVHIELQQKKHQLCLQKVTPNTIKKSGAQKKRSSAPAIGSYVS
jgi:hypothetical protein